MGNNNKFCESCGNEVSFSAKFCESCGNTLIKENTSSDSKDELISKTKITKKKSSNVLQNIIIIVGVLVGLVVIIDQCVPDVEESNKDIKNTPAPKSTPSAVTAPAPKSTPKVIAPPAPKSYVKVASFSGKGRGSTKAFQLFGGSIKVITIVQPDINTQVHTGRIAFYIRPVKPDIFNTENFDQTYTKTTKTTLTNYIHDLSNGSYYVQTIGTGSDWSIEIYEER